MDIIIDQQVALEKPYSLMLAGSGLAKETATVHHHSICFKMNNKKRIVNLEYFREMLQICPRIPNQQFDELTFEEEILAFLKELGHSEEIKMITNVNINKLHQPWRSFASVINKYLSGKSTSYGSLRLSQARILWGMYHKKNVDFAYLLWEDFMYQVEHKDAKKSNEMYYPRFKKVIVNFFMTKDQSIPRRNKPMAEVQLSAEHNILANEQHHSKNIDLESSMARLLAENAMLNKENEHLKQTYKDLSDSIKKTSVQTKDHADSLIVQLNFTPHDLLKVREYAPLKPYHVNAPSSSRNSQKESYGSNDMAYNYYLEEAKKKTQDKNRNLKPREMPSAKTHYTPNACTPKPRSNNQTSRNCPTSKSYPMSHTQKPDRKIVTGRSFSHNNSFDVQEKTNTPRFCLRWIPTCRMFNTAGLKWVPTGKTFTCITTMVDCEPKNGLNEYMTNPYNCDQTLNVSAVGKKKVVVTEAVIRDVLRLDDAEGVNCLPNEEIFIELARIGYEKPSTKLTFYKTFFSSQWKFIIHTILQCMSAKRTSWNEFSSSMASAVKVFANMRRVGKGFSEVETPLFEGMLVGQEIEEERDANKHVEEVTARDAAHGDDSVAHSEVPTVTQEPSIPSPTPPTLPPQPPQDLPSTSQSSSRTLDAYAALTRRVEHLKYDKIAQALEITKLKKRVKKLEKENKVKVLKLRRLQKVETSQRVDTFDDTMIDDESNQGRMIDEIDKDDVVVLMDEKEEDKKVEEAKEDESEPAEVQEGVDVVTTAKLIIEVVTAASATIPTAEPKVPVAEPKVPAATFYAAPARIVAAPSRRRKGVVIRDPEEESITFEIIPAETKPKDKGKGFW
nr:monodehydroascorbate reductase [Tanacetum cinerariifolium]